MAMADVPIIRSRVFGTTSRPRVFPEATLVEIQYEPAAFLPMHAHESRIFLLTVAGSFEETFARRARICHSPQLIYRPAGERHSQRFLQAGATCFAIELSLEPAESLEGADGRLELAGRPTLFAMRLYDEFVRPSSEAALVVEETVAMLTTAGAIVTRHPERAPRWLGRAVDMIEARLTRTIRLRDLATEVDRHPVHVSRCFRSQFGCDVAEFVRRRRVHEACWRIRQRRDSLSAIAVATGFSDQSHMGRAFNDVMGCSPGAYARR
jgi:AraC-like DNA-binding protein/quercetin dioxygenase-like cupin family protein